MTPLDDELRRALSHQAGSLPPVVDPLAGIEERARRLRRRRAVLAAGGSALAVAVIVAVPVALSGSRAAAPLPLGGTPTASVSATTSDSSSDSPLPTGTPSGPPSGPPAPAAPPAPASWQFRGDNALATRLATPASAAFAVLRRQAGDPQSAGYTVRPLWAGTTPSGGYDALMFLASATGRVAHVVTYKSSPGGTGIVADQPVGPRTSYADAQLPGDPANFLLVVGPPDPATTVTYIYSGGPIPETVTDGVALFGRAGEARGDGSPDYLAVHTAADAGIKAPINTHAVDSAVPGRRSWPEGAADWVYESLLAGDHRTAAEHISAADAAAQQRLDAADLGPAGVPQGCANDGSGKFRCGFRRPDGSLVTLTVAGGASAGYAVVDLTSSG